MPPVDVDGDAADDPVLPTGHVQTTREAEGAVVIRVNDAQQFLVTEPSVSEVAYGA